MINVPPAFAEGVVASRGEPGRAWLHRLPGEVDKLCSAWGLVIDGEPAHGYLGLVVPVRRGAEPCALKVAWADDAVRHEALALETWNGEGAVRLLDARPRQGALLLERLDSTRTLDTVEINEAVTVAGRLLRRLAVPAPQRLTTLREHADRLVTTMSERWQHLGRPFSARFLHAAQDAARQLGLSAAGLLVDHDLHYENVLGGSREPWLVIDPKVLAGDLEFGVAPLLWRRFEEAADRAGLARRLATLVEVAELDDDRTRSGTLVRCVDYWLWGLGVGLTEDPTRCEAITEWLLS